MSNAVPTLPTSKPFAPRRLAEAKNRLGFGPVDGLGQVKCSGCGCNFRKEDTTHIPGSPTCSAYRVERDISQSDA
jgi:hypothetical protein